MRLQPHQPVGHGLRHLLVRQQPAPQHDRPQLVRFHGLGADRLRRRPPSQRPPRRRRLGNAERQCRRGQGRTEPGQHLRPALQQQRVRQRSALPGRHCGRRQDADRGRSQRHRRDPRERQLPAGSSCHRCPVAGGPGQRRLPHLHLDEPCQPAGGNSVRLAERRLHRSWRQLHAGCSGPPRPPGLDGAGLRDRQGRRREERDAAQERRQRVAVEPLGLRPQRPARDGTDRDGHLCRRRRQRACDTVRADHQLPGRSPRGGRLRHRELRPGV